MNIVELSHLAFRWIHVVAGILAIGLTWALVVVQRWTPDRFLDSAIRPVALRTHAWLGAAVGLTAATGLILLGIVYYGGGALTFPDQSPGLAIAVGLATLPVGWVLYDTIWLRLGGRPAIAGGVSLGLLSGTVIGLQQLMTGRAVFIHLGAILGMLVMVNESKRIRPVESRRLTPGQNRPDSGTVRTAAQRMRHNAVLGVAIVVFMISNHFPLVYGNAWGWLLAPLIVSIGWLVVQPLAVSGLRLEAPVAQRKEAS